MGLVAPRHVGSSRTRAWTCVPWIGRRILNHCATREVLDHCFLNQHPEKFIKNGETGIEIQTSDGWHLPSARCVPTPEVPPPLSALLLTPATEPTYCAWCTPAGSHFRVIALAVVSTWNKCSSPSQPWLTSLPHLLQNVTPVTPSQWGLHWPPS